jgi:hypothetical protein
MSYNFDSKFVHNHDREKYRMSHHRNSCWPGSRTEICYIIYICHPGGRAPDLNAEAAAVSTQDRLNSGLVLLVLLPCWSPVTSWISFQYQSGKKPTRSSPASTSRRSSSRSKVNSTPTHGVNLTRQTLSGAAPDTTTLLFIHARNVSAHTKQI